MNVKDIVIGQRYTHKDFPNTTYLGCGYDNNPKNKRLVIIGGDGYHRGTFVHNPRMKNATPNFWKGLIPKV